MTPVSVPVAVALVATVQYTASYEGFVTEIVDVASIQVVSHGVSLTVRLEGVKDPPRDDGSYRESLRFAKDLLLNESIRFIPMSKRPGYVIARVLVNDNDVSLTLLRAGKAKYDSAHGPDEELESAEAEAREARRGIWGPEQADRSAKVSPWPGAAFLTLPIHGSASSHSGPRPIIPS